MATLDEQLNHYANVWCVHVWRGLDPHGRGRATPWCVPCPGRGLDPRDRGDRGCDRCPIAVVSSESVLMFIECWTIEVRYA